MKVLFSVLLLVVVVQVYSASFDLFGSLDDARDALMSFYNPVGAVTPLRPVIPQTSAKKPMITSLRRLSKLKSKGLKGMTGSIASVKYTLSKVPSIKILSTDNMVLKLSKPDVPKNVKATFVKVKSKIPASRNKFSEAIEDIERALADAQQTTSRTTHDLKRLARLQDLIKTAVGKRSYRYARKAIGEAMFTITKIKDAQKKGRRKRQVVLSSKDFLGSIRTKIGVQAFNDLLAMQGQVTLTFAIDKTRSMQDKIETAKKIARSIANQPRVEPVDYILAPFSDPALPSDAVQYFEEHEHSSFVQALKSITPLGGGDCPELAFQGMKDAIEIGQPQSDSPMYVFTDAGPKDGDADNVNHVLQIAQDLGVVINFFVLDSFCSIGRDFTPFEKVAAGTTGQVFRLKNITELEQLAGITANSLGGTAVVSTVSSNVSARKKRSKAKQSKRYSIPVDDSIDTLVISVTTDQPQVSGSNNWDVSLTTPSGTIAGVATQNLNKGKVYEISNPAVGDWNLQISNNNDVRYNYYAKASSANNIDFEHYFVKKSRTGLFIPITSPVKGRPARAILTLGGVDNVDKNSLQAELVTLDGQLLGQTVSLKSEDRGGVRHSVTFTPPGNLFKIKLKGKTTKGNSFERISHNAITCESILIKVLFANNDYTVPSGKSTYIIFAIENQGNKEVVGILVLGSMGKVERISRKSVLIRKRRSSSFRVYFKADQKAIKGMTITIVVSVKGRKSGSKATMSIPLLVV